jgi:HK97 family phage major capsid protein
LKIEVAVSKAELNHSIADVESMIIERISAEMTRTIESMIITGDTEL